MVLMALFTTFMTTPLVMAVYKPAKKASQGEYRHRTVDRKDQNTQLRILTCFHSTRNIPTMINLIEATRGAEKKEGLRVYAMHLKELSERPSAILMVHKARKNGLPFWNKGQADSNHVIVAFEAFRQLNRVSIRPMTAISHMSNIHEDICASAEEKCAAMIVLPFHKHQRIDGSLETTRSEFRLINRRVLENAKCSVGILVDRGFGGATHVTASNVSYFVTVLFFGGHDDREALAYGTRMAEHPGINVAVIHISPHPEFVGEAVQVNIGENPSTESTLVDEEILSNFKIKISNDGSVKYEERVVKNGEETREVIREVSQCNLFLVGRMPESQVVTASLNMKDECPELGPVGNFLSCPDFSASVLVVQQYQNRTIESLSTRSSPGLESHDSESL